MPADSNDQIEFLSLDDVKIQKHNVRTRDIDDGIDDLASSIKALGLLQPITAYYDSANSRYVVLAGQRRLNAHVLLNEKYPNSDKINITQETIFTGFDAYKNAIDMADVVILTTPPAFRPMHFEYAINQNKHVFMEKPVATDVAGIRKIIKVGKEAKRKKLNVVVGLQRHYQKN